MNDQELKEKFRHAEDIDPLLKREEFAVSLRKKKKLEVMTQRRRKTYASLGIT
jgi:hypothetical protein